jgi:hypothetical protein
MKLSLRDVAKNMWAELPGDILMDIDLKEKK